MREAPDFRANLERVNETFTHELIRTREAAEFLGISERQVRRRMQGHKAPYTKVALAKMMSGGTR